MIKIIQEEKRRDLEVILLDISPYLFEGLGPRDLRLAHHCLEFGRHWPGLGNSPRSPLPRRIRRRLRGNARRRGGQPPPWRQAAGKVHGPTRERDGPNAVAGEECHREGDRRRHGRSSGRSGSEGLV